jgi:hypothetical protein
LPPSLSAFDLDVADMRLAYGLVLGHAQEPAAAIFMWGGCMRLSPDPSDDAKVRAVAWLSAWDSHGTHCTATSGDEAGAAWLALGAAGLGAQALGEEFTLDRLDPVDCYLEIAGERITAVPVFDAPATGRDGVSGALSLSDRRDAILVAVLGPRAVYTGEFEKLRRTAAHLC